MKMPDGGPQLPAGYPYCTYGSHVGECRKLATLHVLWPSFEVSLMCDEHAGEAMSQEFDWLQAHKVEDVCLCHVPIVWDRRRNRCRVDDGGSSIVEDVRELVNA